DVRRRRNAALAELLEDQYVVETTEPRAADIVPHIKSGEPEPRRLADHVHRKVLFFVPLGGKRPELFCGKVCRRLANQNLFRGQRCHAACSVTGSQAIHTVRSMRTPVPTKKDQLQAGLPMATLITET